MDAEERLHALDAVRAFALFLGILFHAAVSFIVSIFPGKALGWAVADNSQSWFLLGFTGLSHLFRMALFFFIAGYFAHLLYHRRGIRGFTQNRLTRIGVPLVVGWCVLTPMIRTLYWWSNRRDSGTQVLDFWPSAAQWASGQVPLTHLWFLYYLLLIYLAVVGTRHLCIDKIDTTGHFRERVDSGLLWIMERRLAPLFISLPLAAAAVFVPEWNPLNGMPTPSNSLIPELIPSVGYGTSFIVGWLFRRKANLLKTVELQTKSSLWPALTTVLLFGLAALLMSSTRWPTGLPHELARVVVTVFGGAIAWYINFAIIRFALKRFATPDPRVRYMADASYWLYIMHVPVVIVLQIWVANWPLHWAIKYPLVVAVALASLVASYHYLVRYTFIGIVLNGRRYPSVR